MVCYVYIEFMNGSMVLHVQMESVRLYVRITFTDLRKLEDGGSSLTSWVPLGQGSAPLAAGPSGHHEPPRERLHRLGGGA